MHRALTSLSFYDDDDTKLFLAEITLGEIRHLEANLKRQISLVKNAPCSSSCKKKYDLNNIIKAFYWLCLVFFFFLASMVPQFVPLKEASKPSFGIKSIVFSPDKQPASSFSLYIFHTMSVLEQLKNFTTIVADSGDFECKFFFLFFFFAATSCLDTYSCL